MLGRIYYKGELIKSSYKSCEIAIEWFTKAAKQGDLQSQMYLGTMIGMDLKLYKS